MRLLNPQTAVYYALVAIVARADDLQQLGFNSSNAETEGVIRAAKAILEYKNTVQSQAILNAYQRVTFFAQPVTIDRIPNPALDPVAQDTLPFRMLKNGAAHDS